MVIALALMSALCYGTSDFVGGFMARRIPAWTSAFCSQVGAAVSMSVFALLTSSAPDGASLLWGAASGTGTAAGIVCLYRGLATGQMGVVAPVSGITGAALPAVVGVVGGDRPSTLTWVGLICALPAVFLVASSPPSGGPGESRLGAIYGLGAGLGFGVGFATIAQVPSSAGSWPVALSMSIGAAFTALVATLLRETWRPARFGAWWAGAGGTLSAAALGLFLSATDHGMLSVVAVISSLYPAATIGWAVLFLGEKIHRTQALGLGLCCVAVALVAVG